MAEVAPEGDGEVEEEEVETQVPGFRQILASFSHVQWGRLIVAAGVAARTLARGVSFGTIDAFLCSRIALTVLLGWSRTPYLMIAGLSLMAASSGDEVGEESDITFVVLCLCLFVSSMLRFACGSMLNGAVFMLLLSIAVSHIAPTFRALWNDEWYPNFTSAALTELNFPLEPLTWEEAESRADKTLAEMTAAEVNALMSGVGWLDIPAVLGPLLPFPIPAIPCRGYYTGNTPPLPRIGVPPLKMQDAGQGFRNDPWPIGREQTSVVWPCTLAWGTTWDPALVEASAASLAVEFRAKGANTILAPSVQVHRVARNGRNFEYISGEDPYLGAKMAAAYVRGVQKQGVLACLKHWAFNEQETERNSVNTLVDERTAWELYYPPFEAGIAAGAASVMCSYNRVNGSFACSNPELLSRDLKGRMGFRGFVVTDWWALQDAAEIAVSSGLDMEMPGAGFPLMDAKAMERARQSLADKPRENQYLHLKTEEVIPAAARRILAAAHKLRLFERPTCSPGSSECTKQSDAVQRPAESLRLSERIATESTVLLKNDGILPLRRREDTHVIALIGAALSAPSQCMLDLTMAGDFYSGGGSGHGCVDPNDLVTPLVALKSRAEAANLTVVVSTSTDIDEAEAVAREADVVVALVSATSGESSDRADLNVQSEGNELLANLAGIRPTIALVVAPGVVLTPWRESVAAAAMMFLGGEHTGKAFASIVFGDASPSGKLPIMLPATSASTIEPGHQSVTYKEGLFTSYRSPHFQAAFPFGHGLSYANFVYSSAAQLRADACRSYNPEALVCVETRVQCTAESSAAFVSASGAAEVAQAYIEFPPEAEEPKLVLRGFHKTSLLKPGDEEIITFAFTARDLSIYRPESGWVLQWSAAVHIGASSADIRQTVTLALPD